MSQPHVLDQILDNPTRLPNTELVPNTDLRTSDEALHICFHCSGGFVYPLDWYEEGPCHWRIVLRCPECEARREGVFEQPMAERLDDELDRAAGSVVHDLADISRANMIEAVEFFIRALEADLVTPQDF
jgi:hypothetical protein